MSEEQSKKTKKNQNAYSNFVDTFAGKVYSRKLTVWVVSTIAFFLGQIDLETWKYITLVYIGTQGAVDLLQKPVASKETEDNVS